nr:hypothetical protein [Bacillus licheniformis]
MRRVNSDTAKIVINAVTAASVRKGKRTVPSSIIGYGRSGGMPNAGSPPPSLRMTATANPAIDP